MERVYDSTAINDTRIILGDPNAKVGKEATHRESTGAHSLHEESKDNGCKLIDFAMCKNVISSTCFSHKEIHKRTWVSPDGIVFNQIDHILIDRRFASSILDMRSYRGANCDSYHYLVKIRFRCRINISRPIKGQVQPKINIENLNDPIKLKELQMIIEGKFTSGGHKYGRYS
jgi:hypothetical protein